MLKLRVIWVGRTRERYLAEGIERYRALLGPLCRLSVVEVKEERGKDRAAARAAEGKRIMKQTPSYVLLDERGQEFSSPAFARYIGAAGAADFVIGGPYGVSDEVRERAAATVALSRMTFTHEMARLVLLEQLYRAVTILTGKEYHY